MPRRMVYKGSIDGSAPIHKPVPVNASQIILKGSVVVKTTGKASVAADAPTAGTVWGVAAESVTTGGSVGDSDVVLIDVNPNSIYEMPHNLTGTKTSATASDIGKVFDFLADAFTVDLDDTTGGVLECVGIVSGRKVIDVLIKSRVQNA